MKKTMIAAVLCAAMVGCTTVVGKPGTEAYRREVAAVQAETAIAGGLAALAAAFAGYLWSLHQEHETNKYLRDLWCTRDPEDWRCRFYTKRTEEENE